MTDLKECPFCRQPHIARLVDEGVCYLKSDRPLADRAATVAVMATTETEKFLDELLAKVERLVAERDELLNQKSDILAAVQVAVNAINEIQKRKV